MEIKQAIIAYVMEEGGLMDVLFFCGFNRMPTDDDVADIKDLLQTDDRFGLVGVKYELALCPPGIRNHYLGLDPADEDSYYINEENNLKKM